MLYTDHVLYTVRYCCTVRIIPYTLTPTTPPFSIMMAAVVALLLNGNLNMRGGIIQYVKRYDTAPQQSHNYIGNTRSGEHIQRRREFKREMIWSLVQVLCYCSSFFRQYGGPPGEGGVGVGLPPDASGCFDPISVLWRRNVFWNIVTWSKLVYGSYCVCFGWFWK